MEEMKSLHKVYKSANVNLGQTKSIEYIEKESLKVSLDIEELEVDEQFEIDNMINEAKNECERLIVKAQAEANEILSEAYEDSQAILEKAKEDGYKEGFEIGRNEGFNLYTGLINEAKELKQEAYKFKSEIGKNLEKDIVNLVVDSIKKIIDHELKENDQLILNVIKKAVDKCTFTESLTIRVSEEEYAIVNSAINQIYMMTEGVDDIIVKSDKSLKLGSVIIDTLSGKIDASIETQIKIVENAFYELLRSE